MWLPASPECVVTCSSVSRGYKACSRAIVDVRFGAVADSEQRRRRRMQNRKKERERKNKEVKENGRNASDLVAKKQQ